MTEKPLTIPFKNNIKGVGLTEKAILLLYSGFYHRFQTTVCYSSVR